MWYYSPIRNVSQRPTILVQGILLRANICILRNILLNVRTGEQLVLQNYELWRKHWRSVVPSSRRYVVELQSVPVLRYVDDELLVGVLRCD